jgi:NitT/TauT family transport system substrate-binding protein
MAERSIRLGRAAAAALMAAVVLQFSSMAAHAQDKLKLAVGQRGNWDTSVSELGQRAGIFKKHGLELELLYTQGGGETQQAVISGSVDIGIGAGVMGVLAAYAKGAPVRIIGAETTGAADLFWYVDAKSPIKSLKETDGKTVAYSTNGHRRAARDAHASHVRTDRCGLVGAAVRAEFARRRQDPNYRHGQ